MKKSKRNIVDKSGFLIPIIFVLGFIPLIVHMYIYNTHLENVDWFPVQSAVQSDFFLAWKSIAIMLAGILMLSILLYQGLCIKQKLPWSAELYLLAAYAGFVILSSLFSKYKPQVLIGSYEVFQPVGVILAYLVFFYCTYCVIQNEKQLKKVLGFSAIGFGILLLIGILQFAGMDFLKTDLGKMLISNPSYWGDPDSISFTMPKHMVYATLYNPNFLSFYFGIMIPVILAVLVATKKVWVRLLCIPAILGSVLCLIGAQSDGGYLAVAIGLIAGVVILCCRKKKTSILLCIVGAVALIFSIFVCINTSLGNKISTLFLGTTKASETNALQAIRTENDGVYFILKNDKELCIRYDFDYTTGFMNVTFETEAGSELPSTLDPVSNYTTLSDENYGDYTVFPILKDDIYGMGITFDNHNYYFSHEISADDQTYYYYNTADKFVKTDQTASVDLFCDDAFSGRGNIWNKILPKLKNHIFMGSGANTFQLVYPQDDYVYKEYAGLINLFTVKAHNWFLQEWTETGLLGTLCLFGFYLWYFIRSLRIYHNCNLKNGTAVIGFGIFVGTISYMAAGLVSDSNVCTAPVFWVMMGLGMAINRMIAEKEELFATSCNDGAMDIIPAENESTTISSGAVKTSPATSTKGTKKKSRKQRKQERK